MEGRWRLVIAAAVGMAAAATARLTEIAGADIWVVACWIAGVVAALVAPTWSGYGAAVAGILAGVTASVALTGQYAGLAWLVIAVEAAVLAHGFVVGGAIDRACRLRTLADRWVLAGFAAGVGLLLFFVLLAAEFARNPP